MMYNVISSEGTMTIKLTGVIPKYAYKFPDGSTVTYKAVVYDVTLSGQRHEVLIGFAETKVFGTKRRGVVVFVDGHPEAEFVGADDYHVTGRLVAVVRRPDRKYMDVKDLHPEYVGLPVFDHSTFIAKGFKGKAGLVVMECDHDLMIRHALIQTKWRKAR